MKKLILMLLALSVLSQSCEAAPRWVKTTVKIVIYAAPVVTSLLATKGGVDCRHRNDVERCSGGYGAFNAREYGARLGFSVTMSGLSMWGHKEEYKEWFVPAVATATYNTFWWRHEESIRTFKRDHDEH